MKRLITASDVKTSREKGEKSIYIDGNTIITPSAKDTASEFGITFTCIKEDNVECKCEETRSSQIQETAASSISQSAKETDKNPDIELITKVVKEILADTMFRGLGKAFDKECDPSGLMLVRGNTVKCEKFDDGNPGSNVHLKDIFNTKESPNMGAGFMTVDKSSFNWKLSYEELDYIIEGNLSITINGKTYKGKAGDVFYIPKNSNITWSSEDCAKFFYVTYPANWAELAANK